MKRNLLIFWNVVLLIPIAAVILLAVLLVGFRIVGLQVFTVDSPSMEPTYREGSLLCVRPLATKDIAAGTVITASGSARPHSASRSSVTSPT